MGVRIGVLTISDGVFRGIRVDGAGTWLCQQCERIAEVSRRVVDDEVPSIADALRDWVEQEMEIILTTGGTGIGPRDVTPEATRLVIEREVPGIAETLRQVSLSYTAMAMLSRGLAGVAGASLIVNLPGSAKSVEQLFPVVVPVFEHAADLLHGKTSHEK